MLYIDPKRKGVNASQCESPRIIKDNGIYFIKGYQKFQVGNNKVIEPIDYRLKMKSKIISTILYNFSQTYESMNDLGCNNGYFSILASNMGFKVVNAVDHDNEYLDILTYLISVLKFPIRTYLSKTSNYFTEADVTLAFSLIHWIYSCTDTHGSIEEIIRHLALITKKVAIIEWIEPNDEAIKRFNHIDYNKSLQTNKYDFDMFIKDSKKYFRNIEFVSFTNTKTRKLFLLWK